MSDVLKPMEVFLSYAPEDEEWCLEMEKHLNLLQRDDLITLSHKRQITAGMDWTKALDQHLNKASVILQLISANFVASNYCYGIEMQRAMQRYKAGEACVIPIMLKPVDNWQSTPIGKLQALPSNGIPIVLMI